MRSATGLMAGPESPAVTLETRGVRDGDWVRLASRTGETTLRAKVTERVAPGVVYTTFHHPATQANIEILRQRGVRIIEPGTGSLACGMVGVGRMAEPEAIADAVLNSLGRRHDLAGEIVLVTAGGTRGWDRDAAARPEPGQGTAVTPGSAVVSCWGIRPSWRVRVTLGG